MRWLWLIALLCAGCGWLGLGGESDNAGSVSGPGVTIHCRGENIPGGVGSTNVTVTCPR
jgi:hypothetical protein